MKIIALEAENIKNLRAIHIEPDGSVVVIGGDNEQGKSSVLDSIMYALGGSSCLPSKPIRDGEEKGKIVLDLGDLQVTRTFTEKGTRLVVKNKDGASFASPQSMLDELVGDLSFDPLAFSTMDKKKQLETLKRLLGIDFTDVDKRHKEAFDKRTEVNRQGKTLKGQFESLAEYEIEQKEEVSVAELSNQLTKAMDNNSKHSKLEGAIQSSQIALDDLRKKAVEIKKTIEKDTTEFATLIVMDTDKIKKQISDSESNNKKVRDNKRREELGGQLNNLRKKAEKLTETINVCTKEKEESLSKAKFPVKGLGFDEDGVVFKNIPFEQCSTAQKIKVSVAMGLSMNPKLKVLLIREGSLLDSKNLAIIAEMAEKAKAQIWIERVSKGKECQVIIEDGSVQASVGVTA